MSFFNLRKTSVVHKQKNTNKKIRVISVWSLSSLAALSTTLGVAYAAARSASASKGMSTTTNDASLVSKGDNYSTIGTDEKNAETRSKKNASDDDKKNSSAGNDDKKSSNSGEKISSGVVTGTARNSERARASSARATSGASSNNNNGNSVVAGPKGGVKRNLPPWLDAYSGSSIYSDVLKSAYGRSDVSVAHMGTCFLTTYAKPGGDVSQCLASDLFKNRPISGVGFTTRYSRYGNRTLSSSSALVLDGKLDGVDFAMSGYIIVLECNTKRDCYLMWTGGHFRSMHVDHKNKTIYVFDSFYDSSSGIVPKDGYQVKVITAGEQIGGTNCGCFALANLLHSEEIIKYFYNVDL